MHSYRKLTRALSIAAFFIACFASAHGQVTTGSVRGVITDPNGAAVTNAKVRKARGSGGQYRTAVAPAESR